MTIETMPAKTTEKKFSELAIGDAFYAANHDRAFVKISEGQAAATVTLSSAVIKQTLKIEYPDIYNVQVPAKREIFDGRSKVTIDECCDGSVVRVDTLHSETHRYAVLAPVLKSAVLICKHCGRELHKIEI